MGFLSQDKIKDLRSLCTLWQLEDPESGKWINFPDLVCILLNISFANFKAGPSESTRFIEITEESKIDLKEMVEVSNGQKRKIRI